MNIAFNTLVENPRKPTGSTVFFQRILREFGQLDRINHYFVLGSEASRHLCPSHLGNFQYVNCHATSERRLLREVVAQFVVPFQLWRDKIDVYFSPQNMSPLFLPGKAKVVVFLYGTHHWRNDSGMSALKRLFRKTASRLAKAQTTLFVANSEACKMDILQFLKVREAQIRVVPEACDLDLFGRRDLTPTELERLSKNDLVPGRYLLFVSMIYYYKNVHTLVEAFGRLCQKEQHPYDLALVGRMDVKKVGKDSYPETIRTIAERYGIEKRIKFIGYIPHDDLFPFYRGAHSLIQPSFYETFGKSVLEAMACGVPIVGANTGATPEVIGDTGLLFDPKDPEQLCDQMRVLIRDKELYHRCSEKAWQRAQQFTFEEQALGLLEVFAAANGEVFKPAGARLHGLAQRL
jgi:glycosyltransferase involved in cell wall biosynthesis